VNISDVKEWWEKKRSDIPDDDAIEFLFAEITRLENELAEARLIISGKTFDCEVDVEKATAIACVAKCRPYFHDKACTGDYAAQHIAQAIQREFNLVCAQLTEHEEEQCEGFQPAVASNGYGARSIGEEKPKPEMVGFCVRWNYSSTHKIFLGIHFFDLSEAKKAASCKLEVERNGFDDWEHFPVYKVAP